MNLDFRDGLLFTGITITHYGKSVFIPNVIIDTGAVESIISVDAIDGLFDKYEPEDQIRFMTGIGGRKASVRKRVDEVKFLSFRIFQYTIDFGRMGDDNSINGLIGLDILIPGKFIVDLNQLRIYSAIR
ncbi:retropepsin-like aspartic protease [Paenibacillus sp. M1]|uniref:Retropepsin-like aspartic protease n=1 Tax=Paenibacillus haidiansis TaxID=1574488 RepID=A0ABU7VU73_9BACL